MRKHLALITFFGMLIMLHSCKKEEKSNLPVVQTLQATDQSNNTVVLNGKVIDENNSAVKERGFCWSVNPDPSLNDSVVNSNYGPGDFSVQLLGLSYSKKYYYKAFATNDHGTSFGEEFSFTTPKRDPIINVNVASFDFNSGIATINYHVIPEGNSIISHGVCYGLMPSPTLLNNFIEVGNTSGTFNCELTNLELQKEYFVRIFVQDMEKITYSDDFTISTIPDGPTLNLKEGAAYTSADATIQSGSEIRIGVNGLKNLVSGEKLVRYKFAIIANNTPATYVDSTFSSDSFTWEKDITLSGVGEVRLSFEIWDKVGMRAEQAFNVTIDDPGMDINKYLNVELGSWNDQVGSFFSSTEGITYNIPQTYASPYNQAKIDFLFFKGIVNQNSIASPDDVDANTINELKLNLWTNKNQTRFNATTITAAQFDAIGETYQFPTFNLSTQTTKMNNLVNGQVFLFKTKNNKPGLVKVVNLFSRGDRAIVSVVVQK